MYIWIHRGHFRFCSSFCPCRKSAKVTMDVVAPPSTTASSMEVKCPACGILAKSDRFPAVDIPEDTTVKSPRTNERMSFHDATLDYIDHYFPHLLQTTYRVPASLFYDTRGDLDLLTDAEITSSKNPELLSKGSTKRSPREVVADRFQKDAVEKVVAALYAWGCSRGEVMFILSEYKFLNYCKLLKRTKTIKVNGEHDVLILHRKIGIILIEVKSVSHNRAFKTKRGNIRGAWEQVLRNEIAFRGINANLKFTADIPVYHLIALPNLAEKDLMAMNVCGYHKEHILYQEILDSADNVDKMVKPLFGVTFARSNSFVLTDDQYRLLCARYAGFASVVQVRTVGDAVRKTNAKMGKLFLNPEQLALVAAPNLRKLILTGEYGTGKSLVLKMLAEQLASSQPPYAVFIVSCTNVSHTRTMGRLRESKNHLVEHIKDILSDSSQDENITVWNLSDLVRHCFPEKDPFSERLSPCLITNIASSLIAMHPEMQIALLLDEVPFVPRWDWQTLEKFANQNPDIYLWMTLATGTYAVKEGGNPVSVVTAKAPRGFSVTHLTRCMRMTRNGLRFYKALQEHLGDKAHLFMEYGNAVNGPIPRWYELPCCSCGTTKPFECSCIEDRMSGTLEVVWKQLAGVQPSQISFVVRDSVQDTDRFLSSVLMKSCARQNIPLESYLPSMGQQTQTVPHDSVGEPREHRSSCKLVDIFSFKGCESPVVIFVTPFGWPLVWEHRDGRHGWDDISPQISRATAQIILLTWPQDEMNFFSLQAVSGTIQSYSKPPDDNDKYEDEFVRVMKSKLQQVIETYQEGNDNEFYLNTLVNKGVLVKFPVKTTYG